LYLVSVLQGCIICHLSSVIFFFFFFYGSTTAQGVGWGNLRERDYWGDQDIDEGIILIRTFRKREGVLGTGWSWLRIGTGGGRL
jgi:hypothetical protein